MDTPTDVLVLGAGYAGLACALRLRQRAPQLAITVVDARAAFVERIRLHQRAAGQTIPQHPLPALLAGTGIEFVQARAHDLDAPGRALHTDVGVMRFDRLVIATGSTGTTTVPGAREHAITIADLAGAEAFAAAFARLREGDPVCVVGGGPTSLELVTELAATRPELHYALVCAGTLGESWLAASALRKLQARLDALRITVVSRTAIARVEAGRLVDGHGGALPFALCGWTAGMRAQAPGALAQHDDASARLRTDACLRAIAAPWISVIGDAGRPEPDLGADAAMSCRLALPAGIHAAENLAAQAQGRAPQPWRIRDSLRCMSLGRDVGLVQLHHADGSLRAVSLGGAAGAFVKERIVRFTTWFLRRERDRARRLSRALPPAPRRAMVGAA
ncbi:MAG: FAD-dependent oxidoreductase [Nannocystaceae bacterium]|nr:FAD-dependent oxidoreductase [Nannocystaceae bacterium]